ncbi:MAG: hypothetical protein HXY43_14420 [Fischerella sp.]|uniref:hypothetical protein n=1 Tax=Fischerella sp. TaxID=1191 RepID=UPI0018597957|nr:hypothetical protein [Fischerella sp.]NWF60414.1 hypothetical protein [Fischerella sp.]
MLPVPGLEYFSWVRIRLPEPAIQRQMETEEEEEEEEEMIQTKAIAPLTHQTGVSETPSIVDEVLRSPGSPLDSQTRLFMESRLGKDFSKVYLANSTNYSTRHFGKPQE